MSSWGPNTYTTPAAPITLGSVIDAMSKVRAEIGEVETPAILGSLRSWAAPLRVEAESLWPLRCEVRLENLGGKRPFKIVKLEDGRRVLVDQETKVQPAFWCVRLKVMWQLPLVVDRRYAVQLKDVV